ncbi:CPBP family intramembrane glutamic endopeptidase [Arenibacter latericius]|uniref:CPBP family intramembrane glutamic endopeptidase n=1 Tax=Arenibacter latericius TaxID=86104 RepID=UPI00042A75E8|nr:CPBP family intramembrane glutamic endopeptidase [Arenibacter latericius]MDX1362927.1 CPBP family intramembrane glutamic endopeptidase [Arenibacter latericius]
MLKRVWSFLKSPDGVQWRHISTGTKLNVVYQLLILGLVLGFSLNVFSVLITEILGIDLGAHASEMLFEMSTLSVVLLTVVIAPVFEELLFRGPLIWFKNKSYFKYVFYLSIVLFGSVHLLNFEASLGLYTLSFIIVAPQMILGVFLGYIRIRMGLSWAILLHAAHNGVLTLLLIITKLFNLPLE